MSSNSSNSWEKCKDGLGCLGMILVVVTGIVIWRNWPERPEGPFPGENRDLVNAGEVGQIWPSNDPSYKAIDDRALAAPPESTNSISSLATYLCPPDSTEVAKARAIFRWITHHIAYRPNYGAKHSPDEVLRNLRCDCKGYARLFHALCKQAGLDVAFVSGKSFSPGSTTAGGHIWNAVKLEGRWYLMDCTWGSGYYDVESGENVQAFRPFYFLTPPEYLIFSHFPENSNNQLLAEPVSLASWNHWPAVPNALLACGIDGKEIRAALERKDFNAVVTIQGDMMPPPRVHKLTFSRYLDVGREVEFEIEAPDCRCIVGFREVEEVDGRFKGKMKSSVADSLSIRIEHKSGTSLRFGYVVESDYDKEVRYFEKYLKIVPTTAIAFSARGEALAFYNNEYFKAIRDFDEALRLDPRLTKAHYSRAITQFLQNSQEAVEGFQKVLELDGWESKYAQHAVILGSLAARRSGDSKRAERFLQDAKGKLDVSWPTPVVSFLRKEMDEATLLKEATNDVRRRDVHTYLGLYAVVTDQKASALEHFRGAMDEGRAASYRYWIARAESNRLASAGVAVKLPPEPKPVEDKSDRLWDGRTLGEWTEILKTTKDVQQRIYAVTVISFLRNKAKGADTGQSVNTLVAALNDPEPDVRNAILRALRDVPAKDGVPAIAKALNDPEASVRIAALESLSSRWTDALPVAEDVVPLLKDPKEAVRIAAVRSLGNIKEASRKVIDGLVATALNDPEASVRIAALRSLESFWSDALSVADEVVPLLNHPKDAVRLAAVRSLGQIKKAPKKVIQALGEALRDPEYQVAKEAMSTLEKFADDAKPASQSIVEAMSDKSANLRLRARELLLKVELPIAEVFPKLTALMKDPRPDVRCSVIVVLEKRGASEKETLTIIGAALTDPDAPVRGCAAQAIGRLAPSTTPWLDKLGERLADEDADVRRYAAYAIGKFGPDAKRLVPGLIKCLDDKGYRVQRNAAIALGKIGPSAQEAIPKLTEIQAACPEATEALKAIQGKAGK